MLMMNLNMELVPPNIENGEIKRFHVNVNTERISGDATVESTSIDVDVRITIVSCTIDL